MKTAMQIMLTYIQAVETEEFNQDLEYIKENCIRLIEKEKQQIIEAAESCAVTTGKNGELISIPGEQYYNETFTTNKETLK